jgi:hypothetical protein
MSCAEYSNTVRGTPTFSSGLTARRAEEARRCDQQALLQRLRTGNAGCCPERPNPKSALYASVLEQDHATRCQPSPVTQADTFPRAGTTEAVRLQNTLATLATCSTNQTDPQTRYPYIRRFVPQAPCVGPTAEQLNSTTPKPTFAPGCTPSRFF